MTLWYKWECQHCVCRYGPNIDSLWPPRGRLLWKWYWETYKSVGWKRCQYRYSKMTLPGSAYGADIEEMVAKCREEGEKKARNSCGL